MIITIILGIEGFIRIFICRFHNMYSVYEQLYLKNYNPSSKQTVFGVLSSIIFENNKGMGEGGLHVPNT